MTTILLIAAGLLLVLSVTALVAGIVNAREGFEDEAGFHQVAKQPVRARRVSVKLRTGSEKRPIRVRQSAA